MLSKWVIMRGVDDGPSHDDEALRIAVLGPVRLWRGPNEVRLRAQQRALLALTAVRAGHPVMAGEMIELLWGTEPPASALNTVHRYVGVLRRTMEPELGRRRQGSRLVSRGGGYQLLATAEELDLLRFRLLVERASTLGGLVAALDLWQGRCAANIDHGPAGRSVFAAPDAEMVSAVRLAAELALAVGRPHEVVGLLRRAAEWEPLDESVQASLMLVLAATGRQAEALAAYGAVRRRLADDLGVEPGIDLRTAHQMVLRQDRSTPVLSGRGPWRAGG